jgi:23S rRNA pseudouridine955/2504/2580 synthase
VKNIVKNIEILYEDNSVIIINKPAGLPVQGGKEVKSSLDRILAQIRNPAPLLVHRLDKDTSGILLAAKGRESAALFSRLLNRRAKKMYATVCSGYPEKKEGVITQELFIHRKIKEAKTKYKTIKKGELTISGICGSAQDNIPKSDQSTINYSVLELELGTGRMHQIRRHLAMIGNPVIGDDKYGDFSLNKKLRKYGIKRLLLHASRLIINDEINLDISAPLPEYFNVFGYFT